MTAADPRPVEGGAAPEAVPPRRLTRLTVNITPRATAALKSAAERCDDTETETVSRALQVYDHVTGITGAGGGQIKVRRADGSWERLVIS